MNLLQLARRSSPEASTVRGTFPTLSLDDYIQMFAFNGTQYSTGGPGQTWNKTEERINHGYAQYAGSALKRNSVVWSTHLKRVQLFSEARYGFRRLRDGRPGEMFSTAAMSLLENPQPGISTVAMNSRMIQDVDLAGNAYLVRRTAGAGPNRRTELRRPRADWCKLLLGYREELANGENPNDLDLDILELVYFPDGNFDNLDGAIRIPYEDVMHWMPYPDPDNRYLGMSWITPVVREIEAANAATTHKRKYFENAATPNLMVKLDISDVIKFKEWVDEFNRNHSGTRNAYRTLFLGAGADPTIIGGNMQQMDLANISAEMENKIVNAGGLTGTLLATTEGLKGSSLNAGNYNSSRRSTADTTLANLFRSACASLQKVVDTPPDAEVWYYAEDIPFLQEDKQDRANIQQSQSAAIRQLVDGGFIPSSVVDAINADDMSLLVHSGNVSVQLQPTESASATDEDVA